MYYSGNLIINDCKADEAVTIAKTAQEATQYFESLWHIEDIPNSSVQAVFEISSEEFDRKNEELDELLNLALELDDDDVDELAIIHGEFAQDFQFDD